MTDTQRGCVVFEGISKAYASFTAVSDLSLTIEPGTLVTLLGPSGCGKTTTLRMLAGLEHPTSGRILLGGKDVTMLPANERNVSMVFQSYALFPHMSVLDNTCYGLISGGMDKADARARAEEGLAQVGLAALGARLPAELSGGQQQRVAVARALVLEPDVLLLDEPLSNLDARLRRQVRTDIRDLQQKLGFTAVYVTHDQEEALAVSDLIVVMNAGRIAQAGSPHDIYEGPTSSFVADFIGEANLLPCEVIESDADGAVVSVHGLKHRVTGQGIVRGAGKLAVRPNAVVLQKRQAKASSPFAGVVTHATYLGKHMEYEVEAEGEKLFVIGPRDEDRLEPGDTVAISLHRQGVAYLRD